MLLSGVLKSGKDKGFKKEIKGYWSDIVVSPYFGLGTDSDTPNKNAEGLYEIINKDTGTEQHRHHAAEIAVYNLLSFLWEIETGQVYKMLKANDIYSGLGAEAAPKKLTPLPSDNKLIASGCGEKVSGDESDSLDSAEKDGPSAESLNQGEDGGAESEGEKFSSLTTHQENDSDEIVKIEDLDINEVAVPTSTGTNAQEIATTIVPIVNTAISSVDELLLEADDLMMDVEEMTKALKRAECIVQSLDGIKIFPMVGDAASLLSKSKYTGIFDGAYLSCRAAQAIESEYMGSVLKPGAVIAVENGKFLVSFSSKEREAFMKKEEEMATARGWSKIPPPVFRRRRDERDPLDDVFFFRN